MSVIIESDGKKFEFRGEYRRVDIGDWFLSVDGRIIKSDFAFGDLAKSVAILHLMPETLEFGGIKFTKIGEHRMPLVGEWYLSSQTNAPVYCSGTAKWNYAAKAKILKPFDVTQTEPVKKNDLNQQSSYCLICPSCLKEVFIFPPKSYEISNLGVCKNANI